MALLLHSGTAALQLSPQVEHWDLAGVVLGEIVNLNGQYWQVLSISGRDVTVGLVDPSTASFHAFISTSTRHGTYLSNTIRTPAPTAKLPPPPGPPVDLEPPVWPLWLRPTPLDLKPPPFPPVCLEIPAVGDLIFHPQFRDGERIDPLTRLTPSEEAALEVRKREAKEYLQTVEIAEQAKQSRRWQFWRK